MLQNYLKIAWRNLVRHKGYSAINILGLAIGIACCLLIVLFVHDELSYDRFHANGDRIYRVQVTWSGPHGSVSFPKTGHRMAPALDAAFPEIERSVRINTDQVIIHLDEQPVEEEHAAYVDEDFFEVFSFDLLAGDPTSVLREPFSLVISTEMAQKYFGEADPLGQTLTITDWGEENTWKVTGVMAPMPDNSHFHFDFLMSLVSGEQIFPEIVFENWGELTAYTYLLLPSDLLAEELEHRLPAFVESAMDEDAENISVSLFPLYDIHLKSHLRGEIEANGDIFYVTIFSAIALFILLIAAINYMNLATARSARRAREVGMRKVLGAFRQQLIAQFLGEAVLLTLLALIVAFALVSLLLPSFNQFVDKALTLNAGNWVMLLGFTLVTLLVGIFAGSYPAIFMSAYKPVKVLKGEKTRSGGVLLRRVLVVMQFTISTVLIVATLVVWKQLDFMRNAKLGIEPEQVVVLPRPADYDAFKSRVLQDPAVLSVTASNKRPSRRLSSHLGYTAEGMDPENRESIRALAVDYDFFETLGIEMAAGRAFSRDFGADFESGIILSETAVKEIGWQEPLGKWFETSTLTETFEWVPKRGNVIGVARDIHFESLHAPIEPVVYYLTDSWLRWVSIKVQGNDLTGTIARLKSVWNAVEPERPFRFTFLEQDIQRLYDSEERFLSVFINFAALAVIIACLGILGLSAYTAEQRTKEIGIRKTLGASVSSLILLLSGEFTRLVILATLVAIPLAYYYMQGWLAEFPYRIDLGASVFLFGAGLALAIAWLAASFQAVKAALANPIKSLRYE